MACGTPVIAFARGGALETVIAEKSGIFFHQQTAERLKEAIARFEKISFSPQVVRSASLRFSQKRFKLEVEKIVKKAIKKLN